MLYFYEFMFYLYFVTNLLSGQSCICRSFQYGRSFQITKILLIILKQVIHFYFDKLNVFSSNFFNQIDIDFVLKEKSIFMLGTCFLINVYNKLHLFLCRRPTRLFQAHQRSLTSCRQSGTMLLPRRYGSITLDLCRFLRELGEEGKKSVQSVKVFTGKIIIHLNMQSEELLNFQDITNFRVT